MTVAGASERGDGPRLIPQSHGRGPSSGVIGEVTQGIAYQLAAVVGLRLLRRPVEVGGGPADPPRQQLQQDGQVPRVPRVDRNVHVTVRGGPVHAVHRHPGAVRGDHLPRPDGGLGQPQPGAAAADTGSLRRLGVVDLAPVRAGPAGVRISARRCGHRAFPSSHAAGWYGSVNMRASSGLNGARWRAHRSSVARTAAESTSFAGSDRNLMWRSACISTWKYVGAGGSAGWCGGAGPTAAAAPAVSGIACRHVPRTRSPVAGRTHAANVTISRGD